MTEQVTIATLPVNPNETQTPSPVLTIVPNPVLNIVDYTEKTFIVFGEATKTYKQQMKDLGGKFNGRLKERPEFPGGAAWIFMLKSKPQVYQFVNQVNNREIKDHEGIPQQGEQLNLPTVIAPVKGAKYQSVHWKVYKPADGMSATIKAGGGSSVGEVLQTETHSNVVDTAYINLGGNTSKLVICNGRWQVLGYMVEHSVFFGNVVNDTETGKPANYNYEDIAGI